MVKKEEVGECVVQFSFSLAAGDRVFLSYHAAFSPDKGAPAIKKYT